MCKLMTREIIATTSARTVPAEDTIAQMKERRADLSDARAYSSSESSRRENAGLSSSVFNSNSLKSETDPNICSTRERFESALKHLESADRWWRRSLVAWSFSMGVSAILIVFLLVMLAMRV